MQPLPLHQLQQVVRMIDSAVEDLYLEQCHPSHWPGLQQHQSRGPWETSAGSSRGPGVEDSWHLQEDCQPPGVHICYSEATWGVIQLCLYLLPPRRQPYGPCHHLHSAPVAQDPRVHQAMAGVHPSQPLLLRQSHGSFHSRPSLQLKTSEPPRDFAWRVSF